MGVREGCFVLGAALLKIALASELAAWALNKDRLSEAIGFLEAAKLDIFHASTTGYIPKDEADLMIESIKGHTEAATRGDMEKAQETLAELTAKAYDVAFQKVVECEARRGEV